MSTPSPPSACPGRKGCSQFIPWNKASKSPPFVSVNAGIAASSSTPPTVPGPCGEAHRKRLKNPDITCTHVLRVFSAFLPPEGLFATLAYQAQIVCSSCQSPYAFQELRRLLSRPQIPARSRLYCYRLSFSSSGCRRRGRWFPDARSGRPGNRGSGRARPHGSPSAWGRRHRGRCSSACSGLPSAPDTRRRASTPRAASRPGCAAHGDPPSGWTAPPDRSGGSHRDRWGYL